MISLKASAESGAPRWFNNATPELSVKTRRGKPVTLYLSMRLRLPSASPSSFWKSTLLRIWETTWSHTGSNRLQYPHQSVVKYKIFSLPLSFAGAAATFDGAATPAGIETGALEAEPV